tara:strand:+ start:944 stop:1543 length:600 start_codon:yes stop_codon:yes gene_type:complete
MPESITVTIPDAISLNVTSPSPAGVSVLSPAASSLTVTEKGIKGDTGEKGVDGVDGVGVPTAYTLPATDGSADQVFVTDGSGTISFAAVPGLANEITQRQFGDASLANAIGANTANINGKIGNVSEDASPQLGANLDVQARSLFTSTTDGDIQLTPNGTGSINLDGTVKFKRFSTPPDAFEGGMYADNADNLYFGVSGS